MTPPPPRMRRLTREARQLHAEFADNRLVDITPMGWDPPERYRVEFKVRGVTLAEGSSVPTFADYFAVMITLPNDYPRVKPLCEMETATFHPNIGKRSGDEVCIADYWTPSQSVSDIIIKIGQMLQYQDYNLKSPLNAVAAQWADENQQILPVGDDVLTRTFDSMSENRNGEGGDHID